MKIRDALGELQSIADEQSDLANDQADDPGYEDLDVTSFMIERVTRNFSQTRNWRKLRWHTMNWLQSSLIVQTLDKDFALTSSTA